MPRGEYVDRIVPHEGDENEAADDESDQVEVEAEEYSQVERHARL